MVHSSTTLPPLDTLETFALAARFGSFSAAAEQSGLTHGAVSRQVSRLERWMGVRLFEREARGVSLTPEGMRFFARAEEALTLLGDDTERWSPDFTGPDRAAGRSCASRCRPPWRRYGCSRACAPWRETTFISN